jgi:hypothetical protein
MNDLKQLSALTSLNDMMQKGYVSICTIDSIGTMLGINPKGEAYDILRPLHCVNFSQMPDELRKAIPDLIRQCLSVEPTYRFEQPKPQPSTAVVVQLAPPPQTHTRKRGLMGFLK